MAGITIDEIVDVQLVDAAGDALDINADGSINATVSATDLDIRDLSHIANQDTVGIGDGTEILDITPLDSASTGSENAIVMAGIRQDASGSPVSADGDIHPFVFNNDGELKVAADLTSDVADDAADAGNPIKIGGRGVSGALTALSASNDRYDLLGDLYRRTWVNTSANIGMNTEAVSVTTTAAEVLAVPLGGRRTITFQNRGNQSVFLLESAGTAASDGIEIPKRSSATYDIGEDINVFLVAASGTQDVRLLELA